MPLMAKPLVLIIHEFITKLTNVKLCQNNLVCCKHEAPSKCLHTTNLHVDLKYLKHLFLQMCMGDIWRSYHYDPKLWTPCSLSITFLVLTCKVNGMSFYNKSSGNWEMSTWYLLFFSLGNMWALGNFIVPSHDIVIVSSVNVFKINVWIILFITSPLTWLINMICLGIIDRK